MTIRVKTIIDTQAFDNAVDFMHNVEDVTYDTVYNVNADLEPDLLADLKTVPGKPSYPIQWTSERQRRAYFATDGFGAGIPYSRTGKIPAGWQTSVDRSGSQTEQAVFNNAKGAIYVYGPLKGDTGGDFKPQQQFHRNTGWTNKTQVFHDWVERVIDAYVTRIHQIARATIHRGN